VTKSDITEGYRRIRTEDTPALRRWLTANAVIATLFAAALVAIASDVFVYGPISAVAQAVPPAPMHSAAN
jgi:hypothetical protein